MKITDKARYRRISINLRSNKQNAASLPLLPRPYISAVELTDFIKNSYRSKTAASAPFNGPIWMSLIEGITDAINEQSDRIFDSLKETLKLYDIDL